MPAEAGNALADNAWVISEGRQAVEGVVGPQERQRIRVAARSKAQKALAAHGVPTAIAAARGKIARLRSSVKGWNLKWAQ